MRNNMFGKRGFTLLELSVVMILVGILASLGMVNYTNIKEQALVKEAKANLKLIQAAERVYRMEDNSGSYFTSTGSFGPVLTTQLNNNLHLSLPNGTVRNWDYAAVDGTAWAIRSGISPIVQWRLKQDETEPVPGNPSAP